MTTASRKKSTGEKPQALNAFVNIHQMGKICRFAKSFVDKSANNFTTSFVLFKHQIHS